MAITPRKRGFALLIAVIFMSVMLALGLIMGSLAYKQQSLTTTAVDSQVAFYAADGGLECLLYEDQQQNEFAFNADQNSPIPTFSCGGNSSYQAPVRTYQGPVGSQTQVIAYRFALDGGCVDLTVYKPQNLTAENQTYLFAQGYSVGCSTLGVSGARFAARGLQAHY